MFALLFIIVSIYKGVLFVIRFCAEERNYYYNNTVVILRQLITYKERFIIFFKKTPSP